jgi:uncharacterized Zn finger protein
MKSDKNDVLKCELCSNDMLSEGTIISGNSKYATWKCVECGHVFMKCLGLMQK